MFTCLPTFLPSIHIIQLIVSVPTAIDIPIQFIELSCETVWWNLTHILLLSVSV